MQKPHELFLPAKLQCALLRNIMMGAVKSSTSGPTLIVGVNLWFPIPVTCLYNLWLYTALQGKGKEGGGEGEEKQERAHNVPWFCVDLGQPPTGGAGRGCALTPKPARKSHHLEREGGRGGEGRGKEG